MSAVAAATAWTRIYATQYLPVVLRIPKAELTDLSKVGYLRGIVVPSLVAGSVAMLVMEPGAGMLHAVPLPALNREVTSYAL